MKYLLIFTDESLVFELAQKLLQEFRYPWEMLPLLHAIAKISKADFYVASAAINEGKILILFIIHYYI